MGRREGGTEEETKGRDEWNGKVGRGLLGGGEGRGSIKLSSLQDIYFCYYFFCLSISILFI